MSSTMRSVICLYTVFICCGIAHGALRYGGRGRSFQLTVKCKEDSDLPKNWKWPGIYAARCRQDQKGNLFRLPKHFNSNEKRSSQEDEYLSSQYGKQPSTFNVQSGHGPVTLYHGSFNELYGTSFADFTPIFMSEDPGSSLTAIYMREGAIVGDLRREAVKAGKDISSVDKTEIRKNLQKFDSKASFYRFEVSAFPKDLVLLPPSNIAVRSVFKELIFAPGYKYKFGNPGIGTVSHCIASSLRGSRLCRDYCGWRAPWDQNEYMICPQCMEQMVLQNLIVLRELRQMRYREFLEIFLSMNAAKIRYLLKTGQVSADCPADDRNVVGFMATSLANSETTLRMIQEMEPVQPQHHFGPRMSLVNHVV